MYRIRQQEHMTQIQENSFAKWVQSIISIIAVSSFPVFFLYFKNASETNFSESLMPMLEFITAAVIVFTAFLFTLKHSQKAAIATSMSMLVLLNYAIVETVVQKVIPSLRYWQLLPICLFILAHIVWLVYKNLSSEIADTIVLVICIVFCGLILFNGVTAVPSIIEKISYENKIREAHNSSIQTTIGNKELPNIYYLVFDEYASFKEIKDSYGFDNSATAKKLEELGFNISYDSYNDSLYTETVMTNILNLDYIVNNNMSDSEKEYYRVNNSLFKLLTEKGYLISGVGIPDFYGLKDATALAKKSGTIGGETFSDVLLQNTVIYPTIKVDTTAYMKKILLSVSYMTNSSNFSSNGQFTMFHLECPHTPFAFDENGRQITYENYMNWKDKQYYLGQYKYATTLMIKVVESIVERDPDSIIILQSDHGARQGIAGRVDSHDDMHLILNAVYYKGQSFTEFKGMSGVNTLRTLLNKLFNTDYDIVKVPEDTYAY